MCLMNADDCLKPLYTYAFAQTVSGALNGQTTNLRPQLPALLGHQMPQGMASEMTADLIYINFPLYYF